MSYVGMTIATIGLKLRDHFSTQIAPQATDQTLKTFIFRIDRHSKPSIFPTHYHWYTFEFADLPQILHVYDTVCHGFSVSLTPDQVSAISDHPSVCCCDPGPPPESPHYSIPTIFGSQEPEGVVVGIELWLRRHRQRKGGERWVLGEMLAWVGKGSGVARKGKGSGLWIWVARKGNGSGKMGV
ncbi:hypothetical protein ACFX12_004766 [Malus domestica]